MQAGVSCAPTFLDKLTGALQASNQLIIPVPACSNTGLGLRLQSSLNDSLASLQPPLRQHRLQLLPCDTEAPRCSCLNGGPQAALEAQFLEDCRQAKGKFN